LVPQWAEVLAHAPFKEPQRSVYRRALFEYLRFCRRTRQWATVASAREFMAQVEAKRRLGLSQPATWKAGHLG